jgi:hypothetical protein
MNPLFTRPPTARMLDWSLPGGQDYYVKAISELAAGGGFAGEKVIEISKEFDTNFPAAALSCTRGSCFCAVSARLARARYISLTNLIGGES